MGVSGTVAVIIPAYDRAEVIGEVVKSIFAQTYPVSRVVVVDDGSSDDTFAVLKELREMNPDWGDRLVVHRQENQGKSVALNQGLTLTDEEWVAYDDSDDLWESEKLAKQFSALEKHPDCGACITDTRFGAGSEETTIQQGPVRLVGKLGLLEDAQGIFCRLSHGIMMQTLLVRRSLVEKIGGFDPVLRAGQDVDFLFRLSLETGFCFVNEPLVILDRAPERSARLTKSFPMKSVGRLRMRVHMMERWVELTIKHRSDLTGMVRFRLAGVRSALANSLVETGEAREARGELMRAFLETKQLKFLAKWLYFSVFGGFVQK